MAYRLTPLVTGEYYHICNRGVEKRAIFSDERSKQRLVDTLAYYLPEKPQFRLSQFLNLALPIRRHMTETMKGQPHIISIVSYVFMPNHVHLLVKQTTDGGVTAFMRRITDSYTKYFNTRYGRVGPLFQGPFKAVRIQSDEQLIHVSRYIHLNPFTSGVVKSIEELFGYPWSSLPEYFARTPSLADPTPILTSFGSKESYRSFLVDQADYQKTLETVKHVLFDDKL
ncbi:transposase [Candidatus Gottesmanbacteria bacterium]|nr:transposase [Candidatus Gottesmanbacteria bacterium]